MNIIMDNINPKLKIIFLMVITFLYLITIGCAGGGMTQIDPPSLQLDLGPRTYEPVVTEHQNLEHSKTKWMVKRTTKTECYIQNPITGEWYFTTVDKNNKVVWPEGLWQKMQKDAKAYKASQVTAEGGGDGDGGGGH